MHIQLVTMNVLPGHEPEFLAAMRANVEASRAEPGCLRFDLLRDPEDPQRFHAYEVFADATALDAHRESAHYRACVEVLKRVTADAGSKRLFAPAIL